jgi:uncharacterized protein YyaL (SSP411 family)
MSENRLAGSPSAYLASAAHQPVHWHPWGEEAFREAKDHDRPILLDIGAVWCHWCHVMDGESYEDPGLASFLNEHFVCIKVDRDERPDVDARYQRAVQAMSGQGGWPLTALLTPEGQVFFGGTYFPPDGKYGRPGFRSVLEQIRRAWDGQRPHLDAQALAVRRTLSEQLEAAAPGDLTPGLLEDAAQQMARYFDAVHGGFGSRPKFPHPAAVVFLIRRWQDTGEASWREIALRTLEGMARGGIHDHIGGGFHRYSVDERWIVPHFEKMAYDNSELLRAYVEGAAAFGLVELGDVARGIIAWIRETLADPAGGFGASQDADVGLDDDGDYFTWTREEAEAALATGEFELAAAYYDIGTAGEMHHDPGRNVLFTPRPLSVVARQLGLDPAEADTRLRSVRARLKAARDRRPAPVVDRTRYAAWNAMLASALFRAGAVLADPWAGEAALRALERLRAESPAPDRVPHAPGGDADLLEDQVQVAAAALDAFEHTGEAGWLGWATRIMERVWNEFTDADHGGLFDVARGRGGEGLLPVRVKPVEDAPTPSANGVGALVFARLQAHTGDPVWAGRRDAVLRAFAGAAPHLGLHAATWLLAADWAMGPVAHLVVVGSPGDPEADRMMVEARCAALPRAVLRRLTPQAEPAGLPPALAGMLAAGKAPRGYLCIGETCLAPADSADAWASALRAATRTPVIQSP